MIDFKKISQRYKTDPIFRQKVIKASVGLVLVIGFLLFMNYKDHEKINEEKTQPITRNGVVDDYVLADTAQIIEDKNIIYKDVNNEQNQNGSEVVVNTNSTENVKDDKINDYLNHRKKTLQKMNSTSSYEPTQYRKKYNPNPPVRANYSSTNSYQENTNEAKEEIPEEKSLNGLNSNSNRIKDFFSTKSKKEPQKENVIVATIKGDQMGIKNNQRVTLILSKEVSLNDKVFPKNTIIYAKATFTESRVNLTINNINQVPLTLQAYDAQDGSLGLQVNQSLLSESTNEVVDNQADELGMSNIPVVGRTLSRIIKKRVRDVKIDLLNNQRVILKP
jgi:hypothetical protein